MLGLTPARALASGWEPPRTTTTSRTNYLAEVGHQEVEQVETLAEKVDKRLPRLMSSTLSVDTHEADAMAVRQQEREPKCWWHVERGGCFSVLLLATQLEDFVGKELGGALLELDQLSETKSRRLLRETELLLWEKAETGMLSQASGQVRTALLTTVGRYLLMVKRHKAEVKVPLLVYLARFLDLGLELEGAPDQHGMERTRRKEEGCADEWLQVVVDRQAKTGHVLFGSAGVPVPASVLAVEAVRCASACASMQRSEIQLDSVDGQGDTARLEDVEAEPATPLTKNQKKRQKEKARLQRKKAREAAGLPPPTPQQRQYPRHQARKQRQRDWNSDEEEEKLCDCVMGCRYQLTQEMRDAGLRLCPDCEPREGVDLGTSRCQGGCDCDGCDREWMPWEGGAPTQKSEDRDSRDSDRGSTSGKGSDDRHQRGRSPRRDRWRSPERSGDRRSHSCEHRRPDPAYRVQTCTKTSKWHREVCCDDACRQPFLGRTEASKMVKIIQDLGITTVGMWRSSQEAAQGGVGKKMLTAQLEQLPEVLQHQLAACLDAMGEEVVQQSTMRAALLSMLLMDPTVLLWQLQSGLAGTIWVLDDDEEDLWTVDGEVELVHFTKFVPARRRKAGELGAVPSKERRRVVLGSGTSSSVEAFQGGMAGGMSRCAAAINRSDLQRSIPTIWRRSELQSVEQHFAVVHPLEVLLAAYGEQATPGAVQAAQYLFGSLALVADVEYVGDWRAAVQPVYATLDAEGEPGESAALVWAPQSQVYGRARVGPAECPPTEDEMDSASGSLTATTAQWDVETDDPELRWALEASERQQRLDDAGRAQVVQRVRQYAEGLGCGLLEVAADGNCLPAVVAYLHDGSVQQHAEMRAMMHRVLEQGLLSDEDWAGHVHSTEQVEFQHMGGYGLYEHAVAAARECQVQLVVHVLNARDTAEEEPDVRVVTPPGVAEGGDQPRWTLLFDGQGHWYGLLAADQAEAVASQLTEVGEGSVEAPEKPRLTLFSAGGAMRQYVLASPDEVEAGDGMMEPVATAGGPVAAQSAARLGPDCNIEGPEFEGAEPEVLSSEVELDVGDTELAGPLGVTPQVHTNDGESSSDVSGDWTLLQGAHSAGAVQQRWTHLKRALKESRAGGRLLEEEVSQLRQQQREQEERLAAQAAEVEELLELQTAHQQEQVQAQRLVELLKAKLRDQRAHSAQLEADRHQHQLDKAELVEKWTKTNQALKGQQQQAVELRAEREEMLSQVREARQLREAKAEVEAELEQCVQNGQQLCKQVQELEALVPALRKEKAAAMAREGLLQEQAAQRAELDSACLNSGDESAGSRVEQVKAQLHLARRQCQSANAVQQAQREQCAKLASQLVEMQAQLEDAQDELEDARGCRQSESTEAPSSVSPPASSAAVMEAMNTVRTLVSSSQQVGGRVHSDTLVKCMGVLLRTDCQGELERRLRQYWDSETVDGQPRSRKKGESFQRRHVRPLAALAEELWGPGPKSQLDYLQKAVLDWSDTGQQRMLEEVEQLRERDGRRTVALEQLMWMVCHQAPPVELPTPRPDSASDAGSEDGRSIEMERMQSALAKRNQELQRVQRELQQLKEGSMSGSQWKAKAAKAGAEVTRLEMRLRVAMADKPALESTRMELLSIERKLQDSEFEKHRLQARLDGLQNQQQTAVAAAESRNAQTLEATQRQLQVMHGQAASHLAAVAQSEEALRSCEQQMRTQSEELRTEVRRSEEAVDEQRRLRSLLGGLEEEVEQLQRQLEQQVPRAGQRSFVIDRGTAEAGVQEQRPTPSANVFETPQPPGGHGAEAAKDRRSPPMSAPPAVGLASFGLQGTEVGVEAMASGACCLPLNQHEWLLWTHQDAQSGALSNRVQAWVAGRDCNGVPVAVEYSDNGTNLGECVNTVAWWAREAAAAGD